MELLNFTRTKCTFLCLLSILLNACNFDYKNQKQTAADESNQITIQKLLTKVESSDFNIPDTLFKTSSGKQMTFCLPIVTKINKPNFSVTTTLNPLHGTLTPSVSGNVLCFDYTSIAGFVGLDQFDCKICLKTSGFCEEKTWHIEVAVKNETVVSKSLPNTGAPQKSVKKKVEAQTEVLPPTLPARKSIFDSEKKNNDGYVPKNNN